MTRKPENPFAFPVPHSPDNCDWPQQEGMTLRDHFAGQALAGMLANPNTKAAATNEALAAISYALADAMLAERAK